MNTKTETSTYTIIALVCGVWFLLTSCLWAYLANLVIAYPIGLIGIFSWRKGKNVMPGSKWNRVALWLHLVGFSFSFITFWLFYFFG